MVIPSPTRWQKVHSVPINQPIPSLRQCVATRKPTESSDRTHLLRTMSKLVNQEIMAYAPDEHAVDLVVGAFFFVMRLCEYVHTPTPGRTKIARLRCLSSSETETERLYTTQPSKTTTSKQIHYRG